MIVDMSSEKVQTQFPGLDRRVNSKGYSRVLVVKSLADAPLSEVACADVVLTLDGIIIKNRFGPTTEMMKLEQAKNEAVKLADYERAASIREKILAAEEACPKYKKNNYTSQLEAL